MPPGFVRACKFVEQTYTKDGDGVPSKFMREVGLSGYEPGCIERVHRPVPAPLAELLAGASYADQWLSQLPGGRMADAAICVFEPNRVARPEGSSLEYVGSFEYRIVHPEWFERLLRGEVSDAEPGAAADGPRL